jgi:hypothetical protein
LTLKRSQRKPRLTSCELVHGHGRFHEETNCWMTDWGQSVTPVRLIELLTYRVHQVSVGAASL